MPPTVRDQPAMSGVFEHELGRSLAKRTPLAKYDDHITSEEPPTTHANVSSRAAPRVRDVTSLPFDGGGSISRTSALLNNPAFRNRLLKALKVGENDADKLVEMIQGRLRVNCGNDSFTPSIPQGSQNASSAGAQTRLNRPHFGSTFELHKTNGDDSESERIKRDQLADNDNYVQIEIKSSQMRTKVDLSKTGFQLADKKHSTSMIQLPSETRNSATEKRPTFHLPTFDEFREIRKRTISQNIAPLDSHLRTQSLLRKSPSDASRIRSTEASVARSTSYVGSETKGNGGDDRGRSANSVLNIQHNSNGSTGAISVLPNASDKSYSDGSHYEVDSDDIYLRDEDMTGDSIFRRPNSLEYDVDDPLDQDVYSNTFEHGLLQSGQPDSSTHDFRNRCSECHAMLAYDLQHKSGEELGEDDANEVRKICSKCENRRRERRDAVREILLTETSYGKNLKILKEEFCVPLSNNGLLTKKQLFTIFCNLDELIRVNQNLVDRMEKIFQQAKESGDDQLLFPSNF